MKKMYAALLAAAVLTAGAGLTAQAANYAAVGDGDGTNAGTFQVKDENGKTAVGIYGADGSVQANGNVSVGGNLVVGDQKFSVDKDGNLTATGAHLEGGMYATGKGQFGGGVSGSTGEFGTLKVGNEDVATKSDVEKNAGDISALDGRVTTNENNIATLNTSVENHDKLIADNTSRIQNNSNRINALSDRVSDLGGEIDNVGAISAALAGLHPLDYDGTGSKFQLAAAMGNYDGTQAAAIGGFYHFNEDVMMSMGGATSFGGDNKSAFNVGVSFRVGQGSSGKKVNSDDVLAQLQAMNEKIAALEAENQSLSEKVAALETPAPAAE